MKDPILSREEVLKIVRKALKENNDRDKLSSDVFVKLYAEFEAAVMERVCGEPVATVVQLDNALLPRVGIHWEDSAARGIKYIGSKLYAINRSKA
jgi:hypothetical protein